MINKIIIEGPNNTGKSSLIKMLKNRLGWEVEHCTQDTPMSEYDLFKSLSNKHKMIFDRHGIGEMVYPEIYGRKQQIERHDLRRLYEYFDKNTLIIFVFADLDFMIKAHKEKCETFDKNFVYKEINLFHREYEYLTDWCENVFAVKHSWGEGYGREVEQIIKRVYT